MKLFKDKITTEKVGTYYKIKPAEEGTIGHIFFVKEGRATRVESEYSRLGEANISFNSLSTIEEVDHLISCLQTLRTIMKANLIESNNTKK